MAGVLSHHGDPEGLSARRVEDPEARLDRHEPPRSFPLNPPFFILVATPSRRCRVESSAGAGPRRRSRRHTRRHAADPRPIPTPRLAECRAREGGSRLGRLNERRHIETPHDSIRDSVARTSDHGKGRWSRSPGCSAPSASLPLLPPLTTLPELGTAEAQVAVPVRGLVGGGGTPRARPARRRSTSRPGSRGGRTRIGRRPRLLVYRASTQTSSHHSQTFPSMSYRPHGFALFSATG